MQLISLNTWGGKIYQPLINFIKNHSQDTDIFCFQEVFNTTTNIIEQEGFRLNLYSEIAKILNNHQGYFAPTQDKYIFFTGKVDFDLSFGLAIFIKKDITVDTHGDFFVFRKRNELDFQNPEFTIPRNLQYLQLNSNGKKITICNLHGIWIPGPKTDNTARLQQSEKIINFLSKQTGQKILCGDFNLSINTESLKLFENGMTNLIKKYQIPTTRSKLYDWPTDKFADYTFVSNDINVKSFQVPNLPISDHLPMILEFS